MRYINNEHIQLLPIINHKTQKWKQKKRKKKKKIPEQTNPEILKKLRNYKKTENCFCLECGYDGLMGIEKQIIPWYLTWWVIIPIILTGIGIIPAIFLGIWRAYSEKKQVVCPNCDSTLITQ